MEVFRNILRNYSVPSPGNAPIKAESRNFPGRLPARKNPWPKISEKNYMSRKIAGCCLRLESVTRVEKISRAVFHLGAPPSTAGTPPCTSPCIVLVLKWCEFRRLALPSTSRTKGWISLIRRTHAQPVRTRRQWIQPARWDRWFHRIG